MRFMKVTGMEVTGMKMELKNHGLTIFPRQEQILCSGWLLSFDN